MMDNLKKALAQMLQLQDIFLNQSYDGNTTRIPTYWMVQKYDRVYHISPDEADEVLIGFTATDMVPIAEFKTQMAKAIKNDFEHPEALLRDLADCDTYSDIFSFWDMNDEIQDMYWELHSTGIRYEWRDVPNHMSLTKRNASTFKKQMQSRFPNAKFRTYAYVSEDSPDLSALINLVKNTDWDRLLKIIQKEEA